MNTITILFEFRHKQLQLCILSAASLHSSTYSIKAANELRRRVNSFENVDEQKAPKNLIFFLGDGMGFTSVTAARIYKNQLRKRTTIDEEDESLFFESFLHTAIVKVMKITTRHRSLFLFLKISQLIIDPQS